jgi:hypothetical protein
MRTWLKVLLAVGAAIVVLYGAFSAFALYSNGNDVNVQIHVGTKEGGGMYLRCASVSGSGASCDSSDQATITVHQRDRVHVTITDDGGGGHRHDFNVEGWQYYLWPNSPETELTAVTESVTFTTWATGSFHVLCELPGHDAAGMRGTLVVK